MKRKIVDYDAVLDAKFGKEGTPSRIEAEEKAFAFYTGQIIRQARKEAKMTQPELAKKLVSSKKQKASQFNLQGFVFQVTPEGF